MWAAISPQTWWYILASRSTNLFSFLQKHSQTHLKCSCVRLNSLYKKVIYEQHILSYYISILNFLIFSLTLLSSLRARPKEYLRESLYDHCGSTLTTHSTIGATLRWTSRYEHVTFNSSSSVLSSSSAHPKLLEIFFLMDHRQCDASWRWTESVKGLGVLTKQKLLNL
jgi:hypothetical protein